MWQYNYSSELYHYGRKGMKWGVRRYQNKDGSLTPAGKKRHQRDMLDSNDKNLEANPSKWAKQDIERTKKLTDANSRMVEDLKRINNDSRRSSSKQRMDLSSMTDKELRDKINREILEKQYNDMFSQNKRSKGKEYASQFLETAGKVLVVGSSALGIALAVKELRG